MATGTQPQIFWPPWSRDFDKKLETCLVELKHQGVLKHQHSEPLAHGRISRPPYTKRIKSTAHQAPPHRPMELLLHTMWDLWSSRLAPLLCQGCATSNSHSPELQDLHGALKARDPQIFMISAGPCPKGVHSPAGTPFDWAMPPSLAWSLLWWPLPQGLHSPERSLLCQYMPLRTAIPKIQIPTISLPLGHHPKASTAQHNIHSASLCP
jgi:hypothetical protein